MEPTPPIQAQERTRIEQRRVVYETACALAESATLAEAAPRMLEAICDALGWEYGAFWRGDRAARLLRCTATFHVPSLRVDEFTAASRQTAFASGTGLPGRAAERRDGKALASSAHALKGSIGLFVQQDAYQTARRLEKTATSGDLTGVRDVCATLEKEMAGLRVKLGDLRKQLRRGPA
jgi:HPt (histidine-containing phosphotransfer) domain-containing protein